jgi:hypothetical protein
MNREKQLTMIPIVGELSVREELPTSNHVIELSDRSLGVFAGASVQITVEYTSDFISLGGGEWKFGDLRVPINTHEDQSVC